VHEGLAEIPEQRKGWFYSVATLEEAERQIRDAESYIRECIGDSATGLFAYPYGQAPRYVVAEYLPLHADELGIVAAFATWGDYATRGMPRWNIPRFMHGNHWTSPEGLEYILRNGQRTAQMACGFTSAASNVAPGEHGAPTNDGLDVASAPLSPVVLRNGAVTEDVAEHQSIDEHIAASSLESLIRVEETQHPDFFASDLFRRHFQCDVPSYPASFVTFCRDGSGALSIIGYMHALPRGDMILCGGIVVDETARRALPPESRRLTRGREGIIDHMLRAVRHRRPDAAAIWSYVGDAVIAGAMRRTGFCRTSHPHLMVTWNGSLTDEEKRERLERVIAMGPF
jgi:hypothetical protein